MRDEDGHWAYDEADARDRVQVRRRIEFAEDDDPKLDAVQLAYRSTEQQGLPLGIRDPEVLDKVATLLRNTRL